MVEHLFPDGRGRLRRVSPLGARRPSRRARGGCRPRGMSPSRRGGGGRTPARSSGRDRGHPGRQVDPQVCTALRRREVAGRARLRLRRLPRPALPLLHPRRGRGRPRRRQHRSLPAAGPAFLRSRPVRHRHPPETHHGCRRRALRRQHGRRGVPRSSPPLASRSGRGPGARSRRRKRRTRGPAAPPPSAGKMAEDEVDEDAAEEPASRA